jgi:hypothetical protein
MSRLPFIADISLPYLLIKMVLTAGIVVTASLIAERSGPLLAAMVATLPVAAGPIYFFLALEHNDAFIGTAALGSMSSNMATTGFAFAYVMAAQKLSTVPALSIALFTWLIMLFGLKALASPFALVALALFIFFPVLHIKAKPYLEAKPAVAPKLAWYAIPLRALFVALLVGVVTTISSLIGPVWSGFMATFPVVLTSLVIFLQPRLGGPATGAIIGSGILGLMGFGFALASLHLFAVPLGKWAALSAALVICILWNLALMLWSKRARNHP